MLVEAPSLIVRPHPGSLPQRPRICFVAPKAHGAFLGRAGSDHIGGAEVQQALIGQALCAAGFDVRCVVNGRPSDQSNDELYKVFYIDQTNRVPGLVARIHPRLGALWRSLAAADSDVYYQRSAGCETGEVALWCRRNSRHFIFAAASDTNCDPKLPDLRSIYERAMYRIGLRRADRVVTQSDCQAMAFHQHFGINAVVIKSCAADPLRNGAPRPLAARGKPSGILWVGRIAPKKRFEWLIMLAQQLRDVVFHVVGDARPGCLYGRDLLYAASALQNVVLHGRVIHDEIGPHYDNARALLCTSPVEGFPNTFLEAWSRGTPVVSTVDPDGVVAKTQLGITALSIEELSGAIQAIIRDDDRWVGFSRRAREYYLQHHTVDAALTDYETLIQSIMGQGKWEAPKSGG